MSWIDFFINRPIFSLFFNGIFLFSGVLSFFSLSVRLFPKIENSIIHVSFHHSGASSYSMKNFVNNIIENKFFEVPKINYITSSHSHGNSDVKIHMNMGSNMNLALINIIQKINEVRNQLPQGMDNPIIYKTKSDDNPVLLLAFTSKKLSRVEISDYLNRAIKPQLQAIDGVGSADVLGSEYAMKIWLNPKAMAAYNLTMNEIIKSLKNQNIQSTIESIDGKTQQNVVLNSQLNDVIGFRQSIIKKNGDSFVRLGDIADVTLGEKSKKITPFYNGKPAVMIFIRPEIGANSLFVVNRIEKILPNIKKQFISGLECNIVVNSATYIRASLKNIVHTTLESILVVAIVIFFSLGNLRFSCIPLITIPLSLIGLCFFLMISHSSINLITLLAMVIAIGLVVDDAIIILENVHRYFEKGYDVYKATIKGTREMAFSIITMTLTLVAIFLPIIFSSGVSGKLFSEFAWTLIGAVILSGVMALTLSPMMCSKFMNHFQLKSVFRYKINYRFEKFKNFYISSLEKIFYYKKMMLIFWGFSLVSCCFFYQGIPKELSPKEDEGFLQIITTAPYSSNKDFLKKNTDKFNPIYKNIPEIQSVVHINGIPSEHQAISFVRFMPWEKRKLSSNELQDFLQNQLNRIPGVKSLVSLPSAFPGEEGFPIECVIKSMKGEKTLYKISKKIIESAKKSGLFLWIDDDLNYNQPVLKINIDRNAAAVVGTDINDIEKTLSTALNNNKIQSFNLLGHFYEVIPKIHSLDFLNENQLNQLYVGSKNNTEVPLSALISMKTVTEPEMRHEFQGMNSVTIYGAMKDGHRLSEGIDFLKKSAEKIAPHDISIDYSGSTRLFIKEGYHILWIFLSAFFIIFSILAMQFENLRDPFIIIFGSIPMALMSAMIPLILGFSTINIYSQIGFLTLSGLIIRNGILLIKFANNEKRKGKNKYHAIMKSASIRFRPIIMTTLSVIFGVFPLIFSNGAGKVSQFDIGIVIVFGMFFGVFFTLFFLPVFYYYFSKDGIIKNVNI